MDRFVRSLTLRWLATVAVTLVLLAALLPAPAVSAGTALVPSSFQVYLCPTDYTGTDYLADCAPGGAGDFAITVTDTDPVSPTVTTETDADGFIEFGTVPGPAEFILEVPGDFARFYHACFDGADIFQFDGTSNVIDVTLAAGDELACRWYVIPEDASGNSPSASPSVPTEGTTADFQVFICPSEYSGDDYLSDCEPTATAIGLLLADGPTYEPDDTIIAGQTGAEGRVAFTGLLVTDYTAVLEVPGDFARFYYACFDVTSGSESFLFDGDTNLLPFGFAEDGAGISCRWYVIPEDARGERAAPSASASASSASSAPTAAPSRAPRASGSTGPINVLPSTGTGPTSGDGTDGFALVTLAVLAIVAVALVTRRLVPTR